MKIKTLIDTELPVNIKVVRFLHKAPVDEVYTNLELMELLGVQSDTALRSLVKKFKDNCWTTPGRITYWGSTAAIKELKKQFLQ